VLKREQRFVTRLSVVTGHDAPRVTEMFALLVGNERRRGKERKETMQNVRTLEDLKEWAAKLEWIIVDPKVREELLKLAKFHIRDVETEPSRARVMLSVIAEELQLVQNAVDKSGPYITLPPALSGTNSNSC
jgi:hypothetical protein